MPLLPANFPTGAVSSNIGSVILRMEKRTKNLEKIGQFFHKKKQPYFRRAYAIMWHVGYETYQPKAYQRTRNMLHSVDAKVIQEKKDPALRIFLNPRRAKILSKQRPSGFRYYPAWVRIGVFFGLEKKIAGLKARDFLAKWKAYFSGKFFADFKKEFRTKVLRAG